MHADFPRDYKNMLKQPSLAAYLEGDAITVAEDGRAEGIVLHARWTREDGMRIVEWCKGISPLGQRRAVLAALRAAFGASRDSKSIPLDTGNLHRDALDALRYGGVLTAQNVCMRDAWAQQPDLWLVRSVSIPVAALSYAMTDGARHPRRAPYEDGVVYARDVPEFAHRFTLRTASVAQDLEHLHAWMNEPRVNAFWGEAGTFDAHRAYLERVLSTPHMHPLIGAFDGEPFGYFEAYWAKEDRIAPFAASTDFERGLHMLVGDTRWRGAECVAAWLPSLVHYLFLDDPRTQAVVCEPRHDNARMIGYLKQHGFSSIAHFDFPHKRALLMRVVREAFFDGRHL
ncbi:GNAT family N-acetyltransferase [Paraburkholderia azotifigens]|uniref:Acetyltransferase n=1 Tax=Paraburkholderia azotifigens TaxID=2057004 RepID=A0A5C6VCK8_9BURK|nr:GNAT family N-acetyltransferase [Paraburkholderia azotifigens]TXC83113.1 acetyltransferase [Paraburkholderia azotifigens]